MPGLWPLPEATGQISWSRAQSGQSKLQPSLGENRQSLVWPSDCWEGVLFGSQVALLWPHPHSRGDTHAAQNVVPQPSLERGRIMPCQHPQPVCARTVHRIQESQLSGLCFSQVSSPDTCLCHINCPVFLH